MKSLLFHTRFFFKDQFHRKFVIGDHHKIICEALERVMTGKCLRLIINIAPRYGKTELAVKSFISHGLSLNPAAKFIHLSYSDSLALDNSEMVKDLVNSELYQTMFPEVRIKRDSKAKDKWYTTAGGGVLARAAGGAVTGFGAGKVDLDDEDIDEFINGVLATGDTELDAKFNFGGAIIIDDPIKPEDADQDTIREKVNSRFDSTIRSRVNSRNTPIVVIMQRVHPMDLVGYLQRQDESDEWETISLPCIKEDGTSLWPFKHTVEELNALRIGNDIVFERQYMQNPKPKAGLMFPIDDLHFYDPLELEDTDFRYIAVDPANLGGDDFAAIVASLKGNKIYVEEVLYNLLGADENELNVVDMVLRNNASAVGVEGVFGWAETVNRIREDLHKKRFENDIRCLRPRTAKHVRISSRSSFIRNHFVFRNDYAEMPQYAKFMRNLTSYKRVQEPGSLNKHDEAPDVCEMSAAYYERQFAELWALPHVEKQ